MKRLAFLGFAIATLMAPVQVQAQQCVTFRGPPNPEAELRYIFSHPDVVVCPSPSATPYEQQQSLPSLVDGTVLGRPVRSKPAPVGAPLTDTANSWAGQLQPNHK
jgi:hypothetical protein